MIAVQVTSGYYLTFAAILFTIAWAIRVARRENLVFCPVG